MDTEKQTWPKVGMTVEEAAEVLRVGVRTVRDLLTAGDLPGRKVGTAWRIPHSELEKWLAKGKGIENAESD